MLKSSVITAILFLFLYQGLALGEELLRDDFDRYDAKRWGSKPISADLIFRNQLNQTDGSLRINPHEGGSHVVSDDMFREASIEFEVKVKTLSSDSTIFYYFGFHNTQPWTQDLLWLVVQDSLIKIQTRENGGPFFERKIGEMPAGKWVKFAILRNGKQVTVKMDGKTVAEFSSPEVSDRPMSAFFGANTLRGGASADLQVDGVEVTGDASLQAGPPRQSRQLGEEEIQLASKRKSFSGSLWQTAMKDGLITLSSPKASYTLSVKEGVTLRAIDRITPERVIPGMKADSVAPLYMVKVGDQEIDSRDLSLKRVALSADRPRVEIVQLDSQTGVEAEFSAELSDGSSLVLSLKLTNRRDSAQRFGPTFPILQNIEIAGDLEGLNYFFPWRGGLMGSVACNLATEYGGLGWMQVMAAFNPKVRSGIFFFPEDNTGMIKGLMIKKAVKGSTDRLNFNEILYPAEMPGLNLASTNGLGMAIYYKSRNLSPGEVMVLPPTRLKAYSGDWREPLNEYVDWTKSWHRPLDVPRWFKDSFTAVNQHPQSYFDKEKKRYIGALALEGSEHVVQWAFWESLKVPHVGPHYNGHPEYQPGDFLPSIARGGLDSFKKEIDAYRQKGARATPYINYRFCLRASEVGTKHEDWAAIREPGGDYTWPPFPPENLNMCFFESDKWPAFIAETCKRLVSEAGIDGIYLDELCLQYPCYNPSHEHTKRGESTSTADLARNLTMVRNAMKEANPEAILMTEHAGSDYMSQFVDGSWDQTFCQAFPFAEQYFDSNRLVYFRFCFPSFKLMEWGMSKHHVNRYFFNGMGWDFGTGDRALSRVLANTLKENGDAISTLTPQPLVPTSHPELLVNRFDAKDKIVYTFYNVHDKPLTGFILEQPPFAGHYVELVDDVEIKSENSGKPELRIRPETVKAVVLLKNVLKASVLGEKVTVSIPNGLGQAELRVYADLDDSQLLSSKGVKIELREGQAEFAIDQRFAARPRRLILKLRRNGHLLDEIILDIPSISAVNK
jgi:hypothetical protein